ncbi:hypothetical protein CTI12_AA277610 [Artemisia annua]|uniref:Uncharacterized protein n=1 Tax=Artemisia annua TaxID=35608 RepID=A0A2U1NCC7_ARTAN|nr:hypothetical protein CTI12_AA277610 [Artemisia annua]
METYNTKTHHSPQQYPQHKNPQYPPMYDLNIGGSLQPNIGRSSSQPPPMSSIHPFNFDDIPMYEPQFASSIPKTVDNEEEVEEVTAPKKKP